MFVCDFTRKLNSLYIRFATNAITPPLSLWFDRNRSILVRYPFNSFAFWNRCYVTGSLLSFRWCGFCLEQLSKWKFKRLTLYLDPKYVWDSVRNLCKYRCVNGVGMCKTVSCLLENMFQLPHDKKKQNKTKNRQGDLLPATAHKHYKEKKWNKIETHVNFVA